MDNILWDHAIAPCVEKDEGGFCNVDFEKFHEVRPAPHDCHDAGYILMPWPVSYLCTSLLHPDRTNTLFVTDLFRATLKSTQAPTCSIQNLI